MPSVIGLIDELRLRGLSALFLRGYPSIKILVLNPIYQQFIFQLRPDHFIFLYISLSVVSPPLFRSFSS